MRLFPGSGASPTDIRVIQINKGNSFVPILDLNFPANFTVQGVTTDVAGFLTLSNGTFKISGTFPMNNRVLPIAMIPATAGIWLNNPNFTVTATAATNVNSGLFRMSQGAYNIGLGPADKMLSGSRAVVIIEGGTTNVAGAFALQNPATFTQTGGTLNVGTGG